MLKPEHTRDKSSLENMSLDANTFITPASYIIPNYKQGYACIHDLAYKGVQFKQIPKDNLRNKLNSSGTLQSKDPF